MKSKYTIIAIILIIGMTCIFLGLYFQKNWNQLLLSSFSNPKEFPSDSVQIPFDENCQICDKVKYKEIELSSLWNRTQDKTIFKFKLKNVSKKKKKLNQLFFQISCSRQDSITKISFDVQREFQNKEENCYDVEVDCLPNEINFIQFAYQ